MSNTGVITEAIPVSEPERWMGVLAELGNYDFYHTAWYHQLSQDNDEGEAWLFVARSNEGSLAIPLLLRSLPVEPDVIDATSVYGYPGPLLSEARSEAAVSRLWRSLVSEEWNPRGVVSVMSRMNSLLYDDTDVPADLADLLTLGDTISIDLSLPDKEQWERYRKVHKKHIMRLREQGAEVFFEKTGEAKEAFVASYEQTMRRVGASDYYFFDESYLTRLIESDAMHLCVARLSGEIMSTGLFSLCGNISQYHLSGTFDDYLSLAPFKLVLDEARCWAMRAGARCLHLGGGVGTANDSLFWFKSGFGTQRHPYRVMRLVLDEERYEELVTSRMNELEEGSALKEDYFPLYRAPVVQAGER